MQINSFNFGCMLLCDASAICLSLAIRVEIALLNCYSYNCPALFDLYILNVCYFVFYAIYAIDMKKTAQFI